MKIDLKIDLMYDPGCGAFVAGVSSLSDIRDPLADRARSRYDGFD